MGREGNPTSNYCVAVVKSDLTGVGFDYSSSGGAHNPDTNGDHTAPNGDDGIASGVYLVSDPFAAIANGQSNMSDLKDPAGFPDASAYMTIDFGVSTWCFIF